MNIIKSAEDETSAEVLASEAIGTKAFDYFDITEAMYDGELGLEFPNYVDLNEVLNVVSAYLCIQNEEWSDLKKFYSTYEIIEAIKYDAHTRDFRGADDGTFDYAGTYVIDLVQSMIDIMEIREEVNYIDGNNV